MHPGIRELLTLRDGTPVAARIAEHARACERCSAEIARLKELGTQLRQLPGVAPPARAWTAIEQALSNPRPAPSSSLGGRTAVLVAGLLGATLLAALLWQSERGQFSANHPPLAADIATTRAESLSSLVARSQRLEALLRGLPRPAVERAATAAVVDELQARIQVLDAQLSDAQGSALDRTQAQQLWAARVQLLDSLLGVRYAEHAPHSDFAPQDPTGDI
jgi:hypothetical protein